MHIQSSEGYFGNVAREKNITVFRDIQIQKQLNDELRDEVSKLQEEIVKYTSRDDALLEISQQSQNLNNYLGYNAMTGSGVFIRFNARISPNNFLDLINELFSNGANAISINGIRYGEEFNYFDLLPAGQITFGNEVIEPPYDIKVIGKSNSLMRLLDDKNSVIYQIKTSSPKAIETFEYRPNLTIEKITQEE